MKSESLSVIVPSRIEVMNALDKALPPLLDKYLSSIEDNWQPSDLLPDPLSPGFADAVAEIQGWALEMPYKYWVVLIGDFITEEALPTYETWLSAAEGIDQVEANNWSKWLRSWTGEENRHGDLLNKYLYLSGVLNMREVEITLQHLIADGFKTGMEHDPYKNFVYTSFQELATNVSHRRTATLAKKQGNSLLAKMCGVIASDESRHASAYIHFMKLIFEMDPNGAMVAFNDMMRHGILMPAHYMRESGGARQGEVFEHFADCAQDIGVYTAEDYADIYDRLIVEWDIETLNGLNEAGERSRDALVKRPKLIRRISTRMRKPTEPRRFKWVREDIPYL